MLDIHRIGCECVLPEVNEHSSTNRFIETMNTINERKNHKKKTEYKQAMKIIELIVNAN